MRLLKRAKYTFDRKFNMFKIHFNDKVFKGKGKILRNREKQKLVTKKRYSIAATAAYLIVMKRLIDYIQNTKNWYLYRKTLDYLQRMQRQEIYRKKVIKFFSRRKFSKYKRYKFTARRFKFLYGRAMTILLNFSTPPKKGGNKRTFFLSPKTLRVSQLVKGTSRYLLSVIKRKVSSISKIKKLDRGNKLIRHLQLILRIGTKFNFRLNSDSFKEIMENYENELDAYIQTKKLTELKKEKHVILHKWKQHKRLLFKNFSKMTKLVYLEKGLLLVGKTNEKLLKIIDFLRERFIKVMSKHFHKWTMIRMLKQAWFKRLYQKHRIIGHYLLGTIYFMNYKKNTFVAIWKHDPYVPDQLLFKASLGCTRGSFLGGVTYKGTKSA